MQTPANMIYSYRELVDILAYIAWNNKLDKKDDRKEYYRTGRVNKYDMRSVSERPRYNSKSDGLTDWNSFLE